MLAAGCPNLLKSDMIKEGVVIIDASINRVFSEEKSSGFIITGDAAYDEIKDKASLITPVPGGVGPLTIAMLLENTYKAAK